MKNAIEATTRYHHREYLLQKQEKWNLLYKKRVKPNIKSNVKL